MAAINCTTQNAFNSTDFRHLSDDGCAWVVTHCHFTNIEADCKIAYVTLSLILLIYSKPFVTTLCKEWVMIISACQYLREYVTKPVFFFTKLPSTLNLFLFRHHKASDTESLEQRSKFISLLVSCNTQTGSWIKRCLKPPPTIHVAKFTEGVSKLFAQFSKC